MNEIANFINGDVSHETNKSRKNDQIMIPTGDQTVDDMANSTGNTDVSSKRISFAQKTKGLFMKLRKVKHPTNVNITVKDTIVSKENVLSVNNPPYAINNAGKELPLFTRISPMDAFHHMGITEYNAHNLYGHMEAITTHQALCTIHPEKRPFVLSRSTFPGSGKICCSLVR